MSTYWLVDAENPLLTEHVLARLDSPDRPDRLAWNAFRTLALWDTDIWVPRLLEVAFGPGGPLAQLEWAGASVLPWATGLDLEDAVDIVVDGPEGVVVFAATLLSDLAVDALGAAALGAVTAGDGPERPAELVVVVPPDAGSAEPDATGWLTWRDLGTLALDLAEEGDELRAEQVHRLVGDLQDRFPGIEL